MGKSHTWKCSNLSSQIPGKISLMHSSQIPQLIRRDSSATPSEKSMCALARWLLASSCWRQKSAWPGWPLGHLGFRDVTQPQTASTQILGWPGTGKPNAPIQKWINELIHKGDGPWLPLKSWLEAGMGMVPWAAVGKHHFQADSDLQAQKLTNFSCAEENTGPWMDMCCK